MAVIMQVIVQLHCRCRGSPTVPLILHADQVTHYSYILYYVRMMHCVALHCIDNNNIHK